MTPADSSSVIDLAAAPGEPLSPPPEVLEPAQAPEAHVEPPQPGGDLTWDAELAASPARFFNRELSWLAFNQRVLEEAENARHPLLERLRFLSISANNLDEFYMVRIAGLKGQVREDVRTKSQDGLLPEEALAQVSASAVELMRSQARIWREMRGKLADVGIDLADASTVTLGEMDRLEPVFLKEIFPVLTPLAIDPAHPFPFLPNLSFSLALRLRRRSDGRTFYALVPVPTQVRRFWTIPPAPAEEGEGRPPPGRILPLEDVVSLFIERLFPDTDVEARGLFRVIRDSDVEIEEEAEDLVREFEIMLKQRRRGSVVRVTVGGQSVLASGSFNGNIRLWDVVEPQPTLARNEP